MEGGPPMERIDLCFPLRGQTLPMDHGYALFGALCRILGDLHGAPWLAVHPIRGAPVSPGTLKLPGGEGWLRLRLPPVELPRVLPLVHRVLEVQGHPLEVMGAPLVQRLAGAPSLEARIVIIKGFMEEISFRDAAQRQLEALQARARLAIMQRRMMTIRGDRVVGFGVELHDLSEEDSIRVQQAGLGGRQRMGAGVFCRSGDAARRSR